MQQLSLKPRWDIQVNLPYTAVPTSNYSFQELADIYNQTRVDYIVPMPMNAKRMEQYVQSYDINLDASIVTFDTEGQMAGIGMLGLRDQRAWFTRLGVLPDRRGHSLGQFMMETLIEQAQQHAARTGLLEVIKGNTPAHRLFLKLGFQETRELLVIRRPPGKPAINPPLPDITLTLLQLPQILECLGQRGPGASWLSENPSLIHAGNLRGLQIDLPSGESGWVIYQQTAFQIAYVVLHTPFHLRNEMTLTLLYHLHNLNPLLDTKVENVPALDLRWPLYQQMGYVEAFRRIEMVVYW